MSNFVKGCIPSPEDKRDYISTAVIPTDTILPRKKSWGLPIILDQDDFGTCVGFGTAGLKNVQESVEGTYVKDGFSPLFVYSECKKEDGIPHIEGTYIRIGMKTLNKLGTSTEKSFPYSLLRNIRSIPSPSLSVKKEAEKYKIKSYVSVPLRNLTALKQSLLESPVVAGVMIYNNFHYPIQGYIPTPSGREEGGHCILFVEYDDDRTYTYSNGVKKKGFVKFANSWGSNWGDKGYGYISYDDLSSIINGQPFVYEMWSSIDEIYEPPKPIIPDPPKPIVPTTPKYYKVQVGAFGVKLNCQNFVKEVKSAGFPTYMPPIDKDGLYRVQCGAFSIKTNAEALKTKLLAKGFKGAFIVYT